MEKIRLGRTGMMVSRLGFGGIPIQRVSEDEAVAVVRRCLDLGVNYIDTANGYTTSEERIGKAISGRRSEAILATKSMNRTGEGVSNHLKLSLQRLDVEYIDLYQFHDVRNSDALDKILAPGGPMDVLEEAKREGLVKHIGVTSHSLDMAIELVKSDRFETVMFPFNFITCEAVDELLPLAREHDVGFIAMKPLAGGMLENVSIAFKYLFQFPDVVPIPGIGAVGEIEEIVRILEGSRGMTAAGQQEMEKLRGELDKKFCRRCDYCQPCVQDIRISTVMDIPGFLRKNRPERVFSGRLAGVMAGAASCTRCGECETKCPYELPVIEMIAERVNLYYAGKQEYEEQVSA
ncbi:aldo/keto reductase [Chloroflexota bacterium]